MLKSHKKLHRRMARGRFGGEKAHCCEPVFVDHLEWGREWGEGPPGGLERPARWIKGVRSRAAGGGQR